MHVKIVQLMFSEDNKDYQNGLQPYPWAKHWIRTVILTALTLHNASL